MEFILYEEDNIFIDRCKEEIFKVMSKFNINYRVYVIRRYEDIDDINNNKIFIINGEINNKEGMNIAYKIRNKGDWINPIIVINEKKEYIEHILLLDMLSKSDIDRMDNDIMICLDILMAKPMLSYYFKGESYLIPYEEIYYIEKKLNDNISLIVTKNGKYEIPKSISKLEKELGVDYFCKSHQSCLVNYKNIRLIDYENNCISFGGVETNLLSRSFRKILKERVSMA